MQGFRKSRSMTLYRVHGFRVGGVGSIAHGDL